MPDEMRMRRTLSHIRANPELWDQGNWAIETVCGTAYCYAGWTVVLEGIPIRMHENLKVGYVHIDDIPDLWHERLIQYDPGYLLSESEVVSISDLAAVILGKTKRGGNNIRVFGLFRACNTLDDLERLVDEACSDSTEQNV